MTIYDHLDGLSIGAVATAPEKEPPRNGDARESAERTEKMAVWE
jgi:hypothetical protein